MGGPKTRPSDVPFDDFFETIADEQVRDDCRIVVEIMRQATKAEPRMWGANIVGFGDYRFVYANGRHANWMLTGFSPRKQNLTLYIMDGIEQHGDLMGKLGTHSCGETCLYIKRLSDIHLPTLERLVQSSVRNRLKALLPLDANLRARNDRH